MNFGLSRENTLGRSMWIVDVNQIVSRLNERRSASLAGDATGLCVYGKETKTCQEVKSKIVGPINN